MNVSPQVSQRLEQSSAEEVLTWAIQSFHPAIKLASSFGAEDMVLLDMLSKITPQPRVFMLDTGRLPQETYDLVDQVRARYGLAIEVYFPKAEAVEKMVLEHGLNLFYQSLELRKACCHVRKVEPLERALSDAKAWITGLRREQSATRAEIKKVEIDSTHGSILKVNPLVEWTSEQVWDYIHQNDVPYNTLHDRGFKSIGCAPCTRAVKPGEPERAGRWWWEDPRSKECGLHASPAALRRN